MIPTNGRVREAREDTTLLALALSQMWPIDADTKKDLIAQQIQIMNDPLVPAAVKTLAAKNVLMAASCNIKAIALMAPALGAVPDDPQRQITVDEDELAEGVARLLGPPTQGETVEDSERDSDDSREAMVISREDVEVA